jgi:hypothetical protein
VPGEGGRGGRGGKGKGGEGLGERVPQVQARHRYNAKYPDVRWTSLPPSPCLSGAAPLIL